MSSARNRIAIALAIFAVWPSEVPYRTRTRDITTPGHPQRNVRSRSRTRESGAITELGGRFHSTVRVFTRSAAPRRRDFPLAVAARSMQQARSRTLERRYAADADCRRLER